MPTLRELIADGRAQGLDADARKVAIEARYGPGVMGRGADEDLGAPKPQAPAAPAPKPATDPAQTIMEAASPLLSAAQNMVPRTNMITPPRAPVEPVPLAGESSAATSATAKDDPDKRTPRMHLSSPLDAPLRVKPLLVGEAARPGSGALGGLLGDTKLTRGLANPFGGSAFGAPVAPEPKDLPSVVDVGGTVFDPKSHTNRANLQSAVERRKVAWNALRHAAPEDKPAAELAFKAAQQVEAERSRLPGVDLPILPPRFDPAMASSKHDRAERNVDTGTISGTAGRIAKNTASDATAIPLSLLELGNNMIGWQHIPEGKSIEQHNAELGANIATSAVGGMADQGRGLLELSGSNTLLTNPITAFLTVVDPALKAAERVGMTAQVAKAREAMRPHVARGIDTAIDKALGAERHERWGENLGEMKAAVQRTLVDGVIQRSPVATAIVEALVHGPERAAATVRNLFEIAARQVEQGKVALKPVDLEPVNLTYAPAHGEQEAAKAAKEAFGAVKASDAAAISESAATRAAAEAGAAGRGVAGAQRQAVKTQGQIGTASADAAAILHSGPTQARVTQMAAAGKRAAVPGLKLAGEVLPLDTTSAPAMAREVAGLQHAPARKAERAAESALDAAEEAGNRPTVIAGTAYLPTGRHPGSLPLQEPGASVHGPGLTPEAALPESANTPALNDLKRAGAEASVLKQKAIDQGFDTAAPAPPEVATRLDLSPGATLEDAALEFARIEMRRNADNPAGRVAAELERWGHPDGAAAAGEWAVKNAELLEHTKRLPVPHGAIHRPTPEVTEHQVASTGHAIKNASEMDEMARRQAEVDVGTRALPERGDARQAENEFMGAAGRKLPEEAPQPYQTDSPVFNEAITESGQVIRDAAYHDLEPGAQVSAQPLSIANATPQHFVTAATEHGKELSDPRLLQRSTEGLNPDTMQLMGDRDVRTAALAKFRERAIAEGLQGPPLRKAIAEFNEALTATDVVNARSKNRYPEFKAPNGNEIFRREDVADVMNALPDDVRDRARANHVRMVGAKHSDATRAYATIQGYNGEVNRFRYTADGTPIDGTFGNLSGYADEVAKRVYKEGEALPLMMPYEGAEMAGYLRGQGGADIAAKYGIAPDRIAKLAEYVESFGAADKQLGKALEGYWKSVFNDTDKMPSLANVYVKGPVASSLNGHLVMLGDGAHLTSMGAKILHALSQQAKKGVVAMNLRSLVNNDMSNFMAQVVRRGDPKMVRDIVLTPLQMKAVLDGKTAHLAPEVVQMYQQLARTDMIQGSRYARDVGDSNLYRTFGEAFGPAAKSLEGAGANLRSKRSALTIPIDKASDLSDLLASAYTDLGDMPFRIEEATARYKEARAWIGKLEAGTSIDLPTSRNRVTRVVRNADGTVSLHEVGGARGRELARNVSADSDVVARATAEYGNWAQERVFFDLGKTGNLYKGWRAGPVSIISGIVSWVARAIDIPGLKRGLGAEVLGGPVALQTTSKAVQALQTTERFNRTFRRAAAVTTALGAAKASGYGATRDLARAFSWNPAVNGALLAMGADPRYVEVQNAEPLLFSQPSVTVLSGLADLAAAADLSGVLSDPESLADLLQKGNPDADARKFTGTTDPVEQFGKVMELGPAGVQKAAAQMDRRRDDLLAYATGQNFSKSQAIDLMGLSGGPLLNILWRMRETQTAGKQFTVGDGMRAFGEAMIGATPAALLNVGAAGAGVMGAHEVGSWSGYGKTRARLGFKGDGGDTIADEAGYARWAVRQLLGVGWQVAAAEEIEKGEDAGVVKSRLDVYLRSTKTKLNQSFHEEVDAAIRMADAAHDDARAQSLRSVKERVDDAIADEIDGATDRLNNQLKLLKGEQ